jgi:hypothetical protein
MTDLNKEAISVLNDLIETCKDGQEGFKTCAEDIKHPELKTLFVQRSADCATAAAELQSTVRSMGGDRGEDHALKAYKEAIEKINKHNLVGIRDLVERQYHGVQRNHDQVKALRNQARARS